MSYADDMGFYAWDDECMEIAIRADFVKKSLKSGIHIDENWNEVDVRTIEKEHAKKLMYWYLNQYSDNENKKELFKSKMFRLLRENIRGNNNGE